MKREHTKQSGILPSGYTQLQYIESTGTQWIDTGYKPNNRTYYLLDFQSTKTDIGGNQFGAVRWSGANTYDTFGLSDAASANYNIFAYYGRFSYNQYGTIGPNSSVFLGQRHTGIIDGINKKCSLDNTYTRTIGNYTYQSSYSLVLFGFNNIGNVVGDGYVRIFACVIDEDNIPQRNFIPALRINDSKPGLYDTINNAFYTNQGSGEFLYA